MKNFIFAVLAFALLPVHLYAVDGQVLINQASVMASGGFPYRIAQPGSYKLSGDLTPPSNVDAIYINSNNVTLDLNGFTIGDAACVPDTCGVTTAGGVFAGLNRPSHNITIRNGTISGMNYGLYMIGDSFTLEDLHIRNSAQYGIYVRGTNTGNGESNPRSVIVRRNTVDDGNVGLFVDGGALVVDNTFSYNSTGVIIGGQFVLTPAIVNGNTFYSKGNDLIMYHGGYRNNVFTGGGPIYGMNLGGNLCNDALCP